MSQNFYAEGEEKFGFLTSRGYAVSRIVPTMRKFYKFVLNDIKNFNYETVVDIGSGDGYILSRIARLEKGSKFIGIDPSPHMVYVASKKWKRMGNGKIQFIQGSSRNIPDDIRADLIYSSLSFHHWKDREKAIPYIMSHLNEGGVFNIYEVEYRGELSRRFVKSHTMKRETFEKLGKENNLDIEIFENMGFLRCSFKKQ